MAEGEAQAEGDGGSAGVQSGGIPDNWMESLPEDIRGNASLARIKTVPDLAKSYVNAQAFQEAQRSGQALVRPKDDAPPEAWQAFHRQLGMPEKAEEYEYEPPEGMAVDADFLSGFRGAAHEAGLTKAQTAKLFGWYNEQTANHYKGIEGERSKLAEQTETALRTEWKDGYDQQKAMAKLSASKHGLDDEALASLEGVVGGDRLLKILAVDGKRYAEDSHQGGGGGGFRMTATEAKQEIARLQGDQGFMEQFLTRGHPSHANAVDRMSHLRKIAG